VPKNFNTHGVSGKTEKQRWVFKLVLEQQRPMLPDEYKKIRASLGLSHRAMARMLDRSLKMSGEYAQGRKEIPMQTAMLLRLIDRI